MAQQERDEEATDTAVPIDGGAEASAAAVLEPGNVNAGGHDDVRLIEDIGGPQMDSEHTILTYRINCLRSRFSFQLDLKTCFPALLDTHP